MSLKILVADDSLTIQKVVGITLANSDYELVQALTEQELFQQLNSDQFALVLLDFNLSEDKDGYQLAKELKKAQPSTPIMVMLGTFDSVDENQLKESGISEKVVKPFESHKFITLCESLIEQGPEEEFEISSADDDEDEVEEEDTLEELDDVEEFNPGDDWVLESPKVEEQEEDEQEDEEEEELMPEGNSFETPGDSANQLNAEVEGWGMSIPGVIGSEQSEASMPPVMGESEPAEIATEADAETTLPSDDDLAFPDMGMGSSNEEPFEPKSQLVSIDDLAPTDDDGSEEDLDATNPQMPAPDLEKNLELEAELEGDLSADEFWAADEEDSSADDEHDEHDEKEEESEPVEINLDDHADEEPREIILEEAHSAPVYESEPEKAFAAAPAAQIDEDAIVAKVKEALEPMLEEMVKRFAQESLDKVAWDIMPDLAENLIREELQKVSGSVQE